MPEAALESVALVSASEVVDEGPVDVAPDPDDVLEPLAPEALLLAVVPVDVAAEPEAVPPTREEMKVRIFRVEIGR